MKKRIGVVFITPASRPCYSEGSWTYTLRMPFSKLLTITLNLPVRTQTHLQWLLVPGSMGTKDFLNKTTTWNARTLNKEDNMDPLIKECERLNIDIIGVSETHWIYGDDNNIDIG